MKKSTVWKIVAIMAALTAAALAVYLWVRKRQNACLCDEDCLCELDCDECDCDECAPIEE